MTQCLPFLHEKYKNILPIFPEFNDQNAITNEKWIWSSMEA